MKQNNEEIKIKYDTRKVSDKERKGFDLKRVTKFVKVEIEDLFFLGGDGCWSVTIINKSRRTFWEWWEMSTEAFLTFMAG